MAKKICLNASTRNHGIIMGYTYPVYHESSKSSYVDFRAFDPASGTMRRKKYHLENIKSKRARKAHANELISKLARNLSDGWNPWADSTSFRGYTDIDEVLERYLEHVRKTSRQKTIHAYTSRVNVFREFISSSPVSIKFAYQYDKRLVNEFLDYIIIDRDAGARTRNNYKGWCSALGDFMCSRKYIDENPAAGIPKVKESEKKRQPLTPSMLRQLRKHLEIHDRHYLLAVMMEYYTFIRPTELTNLKINDFNIKNQSVFVSGSFSKNHKDGYVGINEEILNLMIELKIFNHPGDSYLFSKNFFPGFKKLGADAFNKRWAILSGKATGI